MFTYLLEIGYLGSQYFGWQIQKREKTIQGELNRALVHIFKSSEVHSWGAGRTDAKVHALNYVVKIEVPFKLSNKAFKKALNTNLPPDIRVWDVKPSPTDFRPTNDALSKEYLYLFSAREDFSPIQIDRMAHINFDVDYERMREAAACFVGTYDFVNYQCNGSNVRTTERTIYASELLRHNERSLHGLFPPHFSFRVKGDGFLKQMVRLMVGALWEVGRGKRSLEELKESLHNPHFGKIGIVAPPEGLYKVNVTYPDFDI